MKKNRTLKRLTLPLLFAVSASCLHAQTTDFPNEGEVSPPITISPMASGTNPPVYVPTSCFSPYSINQVTLTATNGTSKDLSRVYTSVPKKTVNLFELCGYNQQASCTALNNDNTEQLTGNEAYGFYKPSASFNLGYPLHQLARIDIPNIKTGFGTTKESSFSCGVNGPICYKLTTYAYTFDDDKFLSR